MPMLSETTSPQARLLRSCWSMAFRWAVCAWCTLYWALCAHLRNQLWTIKYLIHQMKTILHQSDKLIYVCLNTNAARSHPTIYLVNEGKMALPFLVNNGKWQMGEFIRMARFRTPCSDWKGALGNSPGVWKCMTTMLQLLQPSNSCVVCMLMVSCCASRARFAVDVDTGHQGEQGLGWNLWAQLSQAACSHAPRCHGRSWLAVTCGHTCFAIFTV